MAERCPTCGSAVRVEGGSGEGATRYYVPVVDPEKIDQLEAAAKALTPEQREWLLREIGAEPTPSEREG